jgi:sulfatase modifying factor 1
MRTLLLLLACTQGPVRHEPGELPSQDSEAEADTDSDADADADGDADTDACPEGMSSLGGGPCIDRYEASLERWESGAWVARSPYDVLEDHERVRAVSRAGLVPQAYISGDQAEDACAEAGKRLCSSEEWLAACQGPEGLSYPYGDSHVQGACNDDYAGSHPLIDYFGTSEGVWDAAHMNDPGINQMEGTVARGGQHEACESEAGAFDLHGNLHEWVLDAEGTFRGGFYADASINGLGCAYSTTAHARSYHDYSTGFRCCADPAGG